MPIVPGLVSRRVGRDAAAAARGQGDDIHPPSVRINLFWVLNGRVVQLALSFVVSIAVARYLGPDEMGVLGFAIAFAGIFTPIGLIGGELAVRDLSLEERGSRQGYVLGTAALVGGASGVLTFIVAIAFSAVLIRSDPVLLGATVVMCAPLLLSPFRAIDYWFEATLQGRKLAMARSSAAGLSALARLLLIAAHASVFAFAVVVASEQAVATVVALKVYRRDPFRPRPWAVTRARVRSFVRQSLPLLVAGVAVTLYMRVDQVMLGMLSTERESGIYAAVTRLSEATYFVPIAIAASFAPAVARARDTNRELYEARVDRLLCLLATAGTVAAAVPAVLSVPLTGVLLGAAYHGSAPVLAVHALSAVFVYLGVGSTVWMTNERFQTIYMWRALGGAALNVGLNLFLIPALGALGAAASTLAAYSFASVFGNALSPRTRPLLRRQVLALRPSSLLAVAGEVWQGTLELWTGLRRRVS